MGRIGQRFVAAFHVAAVEHHAGGAGVDEAPDAVVPAGLDDVFRPNDVGLVKGVIRPPDTGYGRHVKHQIDPLAGRLKGLRIGEIALHLVDPHGVQARIAGSGKTAHAIPARHQQANDGAAQETAAAGHQDGLI